MTAQGSPEGKKGVFDENSKCWVTPQLGFGLLTRERGEKIIGEGLEGSGEKGRISKKQLCPQPLIALNSTQMAKDQPRCCQIPPCRAPSLCQRSPGQGLQAFLSTPKP